MLVVLLLSVVDDVFFLGGGVVKTASMERHETLCGPTSVKILLFTVLKNRIFRIKICPHSDHNTDL